MMHGGAAHGFWLLAIGWWIMTAVMMLPVTWPWLRALQRLSAGGAERGGGGVPAVVVPAFAAGYLLVWLAFGAAAAGIQTFVLAAAASGPTFGGNPGFGGNPALRGGLLAVAGLYQLTPVKAACLRHCRSPLTVILSRWPLRASGALRLGVGHGLFCLGCCWALMLIGVGAGTAGWVWMAALTALVAAEKLSPRGAAVGRWMGVALIALAVLQAWEVALRSG